MTLIDSFLHPYDLVERHEILVGAPARATYASLWNLDLSRSLIIRWLFRLRGLPGECLTISGFIRQGFILLGTRPEREVAFGIAGKFWRLRERSVVLTPEKFGSFQQAGYAKAVMNVSFHPRTETTTLVVTETRISCADKASRRLFKIYWFLIRPFSGLMRREMLRIMKELAERTALAAPSGTR